MMKYFNLIFLKHNFYIALAAVSQFIYFSLQVHVFPGIEYLTFAFFGTLAAYNFLRMPLKETKFESLVFLIIIGISCIVGGISALHFNLYQFILTIIMTMLVAGYTFGVPKILPPLRTTLYGKTLTIALVWCGMAILPFVKLLPDVELLKLVLPQLFFVASLCLPFDVHDATKDSFLSLPIKFGDRTAYILAFVLAVSYLTVAYFLLQNELAHTITFMFLIAVLLLNLQIKNKHLLHYSIDGMFTVQALIHWITIY